MDVDCEFTLRGETRLRFAKSIDFSAEYQPALQQIGPKIVLFRYLHVFQFRFVYYKFFLFEESIFKFDGIVWLD